MDCSLEHGVQIDLEVSKLLFEDWPDLDAARVFLVCRSLKRELSHKPHAEWPMPLFWHIEVRQKAPPRIVQSVQAASRSTA
jgi:hypothetical protein